MKTSPILLVPGNLPYLYGRLRLTDMEILMSKKCKSFYIALRMCDYKANCPQSSYIRTFTQQKLLRTLHFTYNIAFSEMCVRKRPKYFR